MSKFLLAHTYHVGTSKEHKGHAWPMPPKAMANWLGSTASYFLRHGYSLIGDTTTTRTRVKIEEVDEP